MQSSVTRSRTSITKSLPASFKLSIFVLYSESYIKVLGFNAGNCSLDVYHSYENYGAYVPAQWKPFDGYYKVDDASSSSVSVIPLKELSHWDFGGVVGLKAVISNHFTASFNYSHSIRVIQRQMDLRNSNFQLSVGYLF
ncbi:outer membrane beta-barrel protein [Bacteroides fragilis]|jgi:hypothetical protein|uniref:outer membrane beta-barrel protein n=1 Tax=Bacteroides fragilis TaxID=817 RepID=UPI00044EEB2F|nr:outer membrane beta-barrel protein [Bacteroides fragilis]EXZ07447.1 outer membrane beta-barrel domain protein [Bacteroides fragilis str. DS-208]